MANLLSANFFNTFVGVFWAEARAFSGNHPENASSFANSNSNSNSRIRKFEIICSSGRICAILRKLVAICGPQKCEAQSGSRVVAWLLAHISASARLIVSSFGALRRLNWLQQHRLDLLEFETHVKLFRSTLRQSDSQTDSQTLELLTEIRVIERAIDETSDASHLARLLWLRSFVRPRKGSEGSQRLESPGIESIES